MFVGGRDVRSVVGVAGSVRRTGGALLALALLGTGCTSYAPAKRPIWASSEPIAGRTYQVVGNAYGESCQWTVLGFNTSEGGRAYDAYNAAVEDGADALIDVTVDMKSSFYFLVGKRCAMVEGTAIRFETGP